MVEEIIGVANDSEKSLASGIGKGQTVFVLIGGSTYTNFDGIREKERFSFLSFLFFFLLSFFRYDREMSCFFLDHLLNYRLWL